MVVVVVELVVEQSHCCGRGCHESGEPRMRTQ